MADWGKTDMQETLDTFESDLQGGADFFKFKDGDNEVRICPPAAGERLPFVKRGQHWRVGEREQIFNCPRVASDDPNITCFVCDKIRELKKSDDDADVAKGEDLFAKRTWLYRIIDPTKPTKGIQVMSVGKKAHAQIAKLMRDREYGDITDPETGLNITIEKSGSGQYSTEYTVRPKRNSTNVLDILEAAAEIPDIASLCVPATNKQMQTAWNNETPEKPAAAKSQRRDVDDDEPVGRTRDDDPDADPDEATEPERPVRAARVIADPDAEEPTPKRASRATAAGDARPIAGRRLATRSRED